MKRVSAQLLSEELPVGALYEEFLRHEDSSTGTVVLHHGRVKRPGKQVANFSAVLLEPVVSDAEERLRDLCAKVREQFGLGRVVLVHRVGRVGAGDSVLLALVSAPTRGPAFEGCRALVDHVKREEIVRLRELA